MKPPDIEFVWDDGHRQIVTEAEHRRFIDQASSSETLFAAAYALLTHGRYRHPYQAGVTVRRVDR